MTVLLRSDNYNAETGALERTVALPDGEWTIKEVPWSWAYTNKTGTHAKHTQELDIHL